jgi:hypothetical protein
LLTYLGLVLDLSSHKHGLHEMNYIRLQVNEVL